MIDYHAQRKQLFVDKQVQGVLLARVVLYWAFCLITVVLLLLCWRILTGPSRDLHVHLDYLWFHYRPILIAAAVLLPMLVLDTLRLSNRFAGPMMRLKRGLKRLADGHPDVAPIHFRKGDFWHEYADEFNRVLQRMQELQGARRLVTLPSEESQYEDDDLDPRDTGARELMTSSTPD
jgi:hypothetical protein